MSRSVLKDLNTPAPDQNFEEGSGIQAKQTGSVMFAFNQLLKGGKCDLTIRVGDVNTTIYNTISAKNAVWTESPDTCEIGSNVLVGADHEKLRFHLQKLDRDEWKKGGTPPLWDGKASIRIVDHLEELQQQIG